MFRASFGVHSKGATANRCSSLRFFMALAAIGLLAAACGGDEETSGSSGGSSVALTLQEWSVNPEETSAEAGEVTFEIDNVGEDTHEFVVLKTDLSSGELPTAEDGTVDEEGSGIEIIDEVEDLPSGESEELAVDLESGSYVLICNIFEEKEEELHYQNGMRTAFAVN